MPEALNPWSNGQAIDTRRLFDDFGIEPIDPLLDLLPEVPAFMRRGIIVGHRDYRPIAEAIRDRMPFHVLTGFMPSGHPHLGHLLVMREVVWHVRQGGHGMITIADREAHAVRGLSWEDCERYGREYLTALYALGYTGEAYFQSKNGALKDLAFEAATRVNFSELAAIYGFGAETTLAHAMSVITQVADILYPQVAGDPAPTVVPVGLDQDPHIRLTRDVANGLRFFTVEDRGDHVSVRAKNAPPGALDGVAKVFPGSKRYEGHVDVRGVSHGDVAELRPWSGAGLRRLRLLHAVGDLPHVHARSPGRQDVVVGPRFPVRVCRAVGRGQKEGDAGIDRRPDHARGAAAARRRARALHALRAEPVPHVRRRRRARRAAQAMRGRRGHMRGLQARDGGPRGGVPRGLPRADGRGRAPRSRDSRLMTKSTLSLNERRLLAALAPLGTAGAAELGTALGATPDAVVQYANLLAQNGGLATVERVVETSFDLTEEGRRSTRWRGCPSGSCSLRSATGRRWPI